jgi:hypothetical protein
MTGRSATADGKKAAQPYYSLVRLIFAVALIELLGRFVRSATNLHSPAIFRRRSAVWHWLAWVKGYSEPIHNLLHACFCHYPSRN